MLSHTAWRHQPPAFSAPPRFYLAVIATAFRRQRMYLRATMGGMITNLFFGAIFSFVMIALYQYRPHVAGYDLQAALRYVWSVQALIMLVTTFGWTDMLRTIVSGEVITDLAKPCDFYLYWAAREVGRCAFEMLSRSIPVYLGGAILFGFGLPTGWQNWLLWLLVMPVGMGLGFAWRFGWNLLGFWLLEARAFVTMATTVALFFTGSYVPIPFFPAWLKTISDWLPFASFINLPVEILLGKMATTDIPLAIAKQILWLIILTLFVRWLMRRALRKVVIQGG